MENTDLLHKLAEQRQIASFRQHLMICTAGKCAPPEQASEAWDYLKRRIRELGLMDVESGVYRSKVDCLRICRQGPIMLSYPDGTWYHSCSPEVIERILQEHVLAGVPVQEYAFAQTVLPSQPSQQ
ncbi:MAG: (2Fe-2S) ferredoxin domain-containing protein [Porticoccaceae bacterium]